MKLLALLVIVVLGAAIPGEALPGSAALRDEALAADDDDGRLPRIIGGNWSPWGKFPSAVSIHSPYQPVEHCGGVILNPSHVLTSARCVLNSEQRLMDPLWLTIVAGDLFLSPVSPRRQTRRVTHIFAHPEFNVFTRENDIAVLRLNEAFVVPSNTLDSATRRTRITPAGEVCEFAGWGVDTNAANAPLTVQQRYLTMTVNSLDACNVVDTYIGRLRESMICAGNMGASATNAPCRGNLGTGLFCNRELAGILSFGANCGAANNPPIFTQVRYFNKWIDQQFSRNDSMPPNWSPRHL